MLDLKDLQSTLRFLSANAKDFRDGYGNISSASVGRYSGDCWCSRRKAPIASSASPSSICGT